eukprot:134355-Amphidinium_carterae.1
MRSSLGSRFTSREKTLHSCLLNVFFATVVEQFVFPRLRRDKLQYATNSSLGSNQERAGFRKKWALDQAEMRKSQRIHESSLTEETKLDG